MEAIDAIDLGSDVNISTERVKERISQDLIQELRKKPNGTVIDYKITDGRDIGYVIKLISGKKIWVFKDEILEYPVNIYQKDISSEELLLKNIYKSFTAKISGQSGASKITGNSNLIEVLNPKNFLQWILYVTSDIF